MGGAEWGRGGAGMNLLVGTAAVCGGGGGCLCSVHFARLLGQRGEQLVGVS